MPRVNHGTGRVSNPSEKLSKDWKRLPDFWFTEAMNFFAYGTLMWPEIIAGVIGRTLEGCPAVLKDVRRLRVKDQVYPALVPADNGEVSGVVYENLSPEDFVALDLFEGREYDRRTVTVFTGGQSLTCETYFTSGIGISLLEPIDWVPSDLTSENLCRFRETYKGWD